MISWGIVVHPPQPRCEKPPKSPGLSDLVPEGHRVVPAANVAELAQNAVLNALELGYPGGLKVG